MRTFSVCSLAALALSIATSVASADGVTPGKVTRAIFTRGDRRVTYYVFVPTQPTVAASAPLVVLLHGSGRDGTSLMEPWKTLAEKEGVVLLAPDAENRQGWSVPGDGPELLCSLVDHLRQTIPVINSRRMYLFGHSAGAVFLLHMAMLESDYFAAGALHAGAWRSPDEFFAVETLGRKIPLALTVGDADRYFLLSDVQATAAALKKAGVPVTTSIIPNHDHHYSFMSGRVNAWAWDALKGHVLSRDPLYVPREFR